MKLDKGNMDTLYLPFSSSPRHCLVMVPKYQEISFLWWSHIRAIGHASIVINTLTTNKQSVLLIYVLAGNLVQGENVQFYYNYYFMKRNGKMWI